ncbi:MULTISPECIES: carbohydrate ABC transporter permease [Microbacterium]|uniref:carbohydrate ABC transporter permease n=1 Tax=Microbacterium TaxID=33882 RepID=UPI00146E7B97|nr:MULTISPECIES: carbohydrate ABC transporter permease [Microbacterium]
MYELYDPLRKPLVRRLWTIAAVVAAVVSVLPLLWITLTAFKPPSGIFRGLFPLTWQAIVPAPVTLDNFTALFASSFPLALFNSVFVVTVSVAVGLLLSSLAAYGLAIFNFRGLSILFAVIVVSFLIPFDAVAIPLAEVFRAVGLNNTYLGLILPGIGNGFAIFLLRQFFLGIPRELIEAARVDGMSELRIYWTIVLPMSKPALVSAAQLLFVFQWQSFLWPLLIATDPRLTVAPVALASFAGQFEVNFGLMFAGCVVTVLVPIAVLLYAQRYFATSVASTGSKG